MVRCAVCASRALYSVSPPRRVCGKKTSAPAWGKPAGGLCTNAALWLARAHILRITSTLKPRHSDSRSPCSP